MSPDNRELISHTVGILATVALIIVIALFFAYPLQFITMASIAGVSVVAAIIYTSAKDATREVLERRERRRR